MKKVLLLFVAMLTCSLMQAQGLVPRERIIFSVRLYDGGIKDKPIGGPSPKSPAQPPTVYIEENVLYFDADHADFELTLRDEDGNDVYTTTVTTSETEVTLPSTLTGDYEIELISGNWVFTGWIEL